MGGTDSLRETFWDRHSNPKSGWTRVLLLPLLLYAVYRRNMWLGVAGILFTVLNPVLFSPPERDDAWMTRVVRAEQWWTKSQGRPVLGLSYPNILNLCNIPLTAYAFLAAYRKQPTGAAFAGAGSILLKFWYVGELVRRHDDHRPGDIP